MVKHKIMTYFYRTSVGLLPITSIFLLLQTIPLYSKAKTVKKQNIFLEKGESTQIKIPATTPIWLSAANIVSVQDKGAFLHIQARKEGEVLMNTGSQLYFIQVLSEKNKKYMNILNEFMSYRKGLKVHFKNGQIKIQGQLYRIKDFLQLSKLAQKLHISYSFEAEISVHLRKKLKTIIYDYINENNNTITQSPVLLWQTPLTALIPDDHLLNNFYQKKLQPFGISVKKDSSLLTSATLIELKVFLMESSFNQSTQNHINWGDQVINQLLNGHLFKNIFSDFKAMSNKGKAKMLSEATLLIESGKKAHFHSGGEVPIPYFNPETNTQGIKWKPYGVRLNIKATTDWNNNIHINTETEISEVDHSHSAHQAPSIKNNRIHSSLTMQNDQTLLLSQLIRQQKGKSYSAPLAISKIPIIGTSLSFKGKANTNTRLSIFITPSIKKNIRSK